MTATLKSCILSGKYLSMVENPDKRDTRARGKIQRPPFFVLSAGFWSHAPASRARVSRFSPFHGNGPCNRQGTDPEPLSGPAESREALAGLRLSSAPNTCEREKRGPPMARPGRAFDGRPPQHRPRTGERIPAWQVISNHASFWRRSTSGHLPAATGICPAGSGLPASSLS